MPLTPGFELVIDPPMIRRASAFMAGLDAARPADSVVSPIYLGLKKTLVVYGAGASSRKDYIARHVAEGGRVVYWDLAYWDRFRSMRLSIDGLHPTAEQLEGLYPGRPRRSFQLRNAYKKDGHILLIGLGPKSEKSLSVDAKAWATAKARALRDRFAGRRVIWRPKKYLFKVPGTGMTR